MNITQINNATSFKQTFMPGYSHYTESQKAIAGDIEQKIKDNIKEYPFSKTSESIYRPDFLIAREGKKDSLTVYNCFRSYSYRWLEPEYCDKLYVGTYDIEHPFNIEDIAKAKEKKGLKKFFAGILASVAAIFSISKAKSAPRIKI